MRRLADNACCCILSIIMWAKQKGFTIVELLIVIVVIAILAAITIVSYNGIQNRANDSAVQSDLTAFVKKMEMLKIDSPTGTYPSTLTSAMGFTFSEDAYGRDDQSRNLRYCYNSSTDSYIMMANSKSKVYFKAQNGTVSVTPATYGYGVCILVGLSTTNPSQDGFYASNTPPWSAWTN